MVQPSVPWPVLSHRFFIRCAADHRRAVRRHRPQARPERRLLHVAAAREQIAHHHLQGFATRLQQRFVKTDDLRHAADPNALIEAGDGDFVSLIKDS